jgi:dTDP-glucose 4,6-dehydratase
MSNERGDFHLTGARVLVTGGAGFIGSHLVRRLLQRFEEITVVTLDALTYAGQRSNLAAVENDPRHRFVVGDVSDPEVVDNLVAEVDAVLHLAAETHVDRSIDEGLSFVRTDAVGTATLLEATRRHDVQRFLHVSTDEVYGEIPSGSVDETAALKPRNPYSASKAAGDHLAQAYQITHGLPVIIARPSNHYGPHQYPEKFIPLFTVNAIERRPLPLYGDGKQRREWTHVVDGVDALIHLVEHGAPGQAYNVSSGEERPNIDVAQAICAATGADPALITLVNDRPGHDRRYSIDSDRLLALDWKARIPFEEGLAETVAWYVDNRDWWEPIVRDSPAYRGWISRQYSNLTDVSSNESERE